DVAAGRGSAGNLAALVSVGLLLRDGWSHQQCQRDGNGDRPHLSRSSFLHNGASACVWHHSATACSTSERVMPRGFGSISSIALPEGGSGEPRVGNSWQAMKPRRTASRLLSR